jgi:hypothetical protein
LDIHAIPARLQDRRKACVPSDIAQPSRANARQEVNRVDFRDVRDTIRFALEG